MSSPSRSIQNPDVVTNSSDSNTDHLIARPPKRPKPPVTPSVEPSLAAHKPTKLAAAPIKPPARSVSAPSVTPVAASTPTSEPALVDRSRPIPAPSDPKQFRAIGLVRGKYIPSEEQFNCGTFVTDDGAELDAVLLGRVMSLIKKHIDLDASHLWVAYPRTQQKSDSLHLQIVGVWEPETLAQEDATDDDQPIASSELEDDNYFSIRGEVVFYSDDRACTVVKIRQAPRKKDENPRFFKLSLSGKLEGRTLGHFWDFHVRRNGTILEIERGECIGPMPPKRKPKRGGRKPFHKPRGAHGDHAPRRDTPKPQLRRKADNEGSAPTSGTPE